MRSDPHPDFSVVERLVAEAVGSVFPGAALLLRAPGGLSYLHAWGSLSSDSQDGPTHTDTIFDVSSLTKPLATTTAIMVLVAEGRIDLDAPVAESFPQWTGTDRAPVTYRHLLSHRSGLPAWRPYFEVVQRRGAELGRDDFVGSRAARALVLQAVLEEPLESAVGTRTVYSDLNFVVLGALVEVVSGQALDVFCQDRVFSPCGLRDTCFGPLVREDPRFTRTAPTERCPWRGRLLRGEVHDDNAFAMGGAAGHAGLFSTVEDVGRLTATLLACYHGEGSFLPSRLLREFWAVEQSVARLPRVLGWDRPAEEGSQAGSRFSPRTVGHLGFTGTSVWLDLETGRDVVFLSNRVHPTRRNEAIRSFRPRLHDLIHQVLDAA